MTIMAVIVIDPGHGGFDSGAVSAHGIKESDINLIMAKEIILRLSVDHHVTTTRFGDGYITLRQRSEYANAERADLFASIHCNAATTPSATGFEVWTSHGETGADQFATKIYTAIRDEFPDHRARADHYDGDPDKEADFAVLRLTAMPAVLVELGFLSNPHDALLLASYSWRVRMAKAIVRGIEQGFGPPAARLVRG